MVPETDIQTFAAAHAAGALVVDVREPYEYAMGHVPGARLVPLRRVHAHLGDLPKGPPVYVICASGNRSLAAAGWMRGAGVEAVSVAGGTSAWAGQGRPLVRGARANESAA